uniref:Uncharacterized protein n=1 Tax=Anguilla anguilla TaxID=7936 RepID=A0A0E9WEJ6_ANGAN
MEIFQELIMCIPLLRTVSFSQKGLQYVTVTYTYNTAYAHVIICALHREPGRVTCTVCVVFTCFQ